jgi:serine/threonine protein kinase
MGTQESATDILKEVNSLRARRHRSILPLSAAFIVAENESSQNLFIVTPYAEGGNMNDWLRSKTTPLQPPDMFDEASRKFFIYQSIRSLTEAVAYIHSKIDDRWCGHFDIKPNNILLFLENRVWLWKIGDFGHSDLKYSTEKGTTRKAMGTNRYQPPEYYQSMSETQYGLYFDVWSLGCVLLELTTIGVFSWTDNMMISLEIELNAEFNSGEQFSYRVPGIIPAWARYLKNATREEKVHRVISIIQEMLANEIRSRLYAFDAALDFLELLNPNIGDNEFEELCQQLIKGQAPTASLGEFYEPILRLRMEPMHHNQRYTEIRTRYLLKEGWPNRHRVPQNSANGIGIDTLPALSNLPLRYQEEGFYGREEMKTRLKLLFQTTAVVALVGLGGIGKSHLAYEYASQAQKDEAELGRVLHTFWVRCRNASSFEESYLEISGIAHEAHHQEVSEQTGSNYGTPQILKRVKRVLLDLKCNWILVVDGVEDANAEWLRWCPFEQQGTKAYGKILITTKNKEVALKLVSQPHNVITVESLDVNDSVALLSQGINTIALEDRKDAMELVEKLYLPVLIKLIGRQITIKGPGGQNLAKMSHRLSNKEELIRQISRLDAKDIRFEELRAVRRVYDIVFSEFFETQSDCRDVFRLLCHFSNDNINRQWMECDFGVELLEDTFSALTNRGFLKLVDANGSRYAMHDIVQSMYMAWIRSRSSDPAKDLWYGYTRALAIIYESYRPRRASQKRSDEGRSTPSHLMKLRYKDHVEEFLKYVDHHGDNLGKFFQTAAEAVVTFARWFDDEGRVAVGQRLLRLVIDQGVKEDSTRRCELQARRDLIQSLTSNASGRTKRDVLDRGRLEANKALQIALKVGDMVSIWKTRRECIYLFCAMEKFNDAKEQLQILRDMRSQLPQSNTFELDLRGCEDMYDFSRGRITGDPEKLESTRLRLREEIKSLHGVSSNNDKIVEQLENRKGDLALTCLTLLEALGTYQPEDRAKCDKGRELWNEALQQYTDVHKQRDARYTAEAREHRNHKRVNDAYRNIFIARLRYGFWMKDSEPKIKARLIDAVDGLRDILKVYETKANLKTSNTDVRCTAYWLLRGLNRLSELEQTMEYEKELAALRKKYDLIDAVERNVRAM